MKSDTVATHKDLEVWRQSMDLAHDIYVISASFPKEELYGLSAQARRSAISIPSNIAEGAGRQSKREFVQFLYVALGSAAELETQLLLAGRMRFCAVDTPLERLHRVRKMLVGLIHSLKRGLGSPTRHSSPVTRYPSS
jgi:four helix bundle protein